LVVNSIQFVVWWERISEKEQHEPVRDYVTLLCAIQLLDVLKKEELEFYTSERKRFDLVAEVRTALNPVKARLSFANEQEQEKERFFRMVRALVPPPRLPGS
jgi:hypothetical protein